MRILQGFKSFVLEVINPKGLGEDFTEVRVLKDLGAFPPGARESVAGGNPAGQEGRKEERCREMGRDGGAVERIMQNAIMIFLRCQVLR
jgi:hypothetical protein